MRYLVAGAGGFIGGHLVSIYEGRAWSYMCWYKASSILVSNIRRKKNYSLDLKEYENCGK